MPDMGSVAKYMSSKLMFKSNLAKSGLSVFYVSFIKTFLFQKYGNIIFLSLCKIPVGLTT